MSIGTIGKLSISGCGGIISLSYEREEWIWNLILGEKMTV